jgi:hypothetical protein
MIYKVAYKGNGIRFKDCNEMVLAKTEREAVERFYSVICDANYFTQDGNIFDCDGNIIATPESNTIEYDNGYFYAELIE